MDEAAGPPRRSPRSRARRAVGRLRSMRLRAVLVALVASLWPLAVLDLPDGDGLRWRVMAVVLPGAAVLGAWLAWRIVRPLERLRSAVLARTLQAEPQPGLGLERDDEYGDLAAAFDDLLEQLDARGRKLQRFAADLAHEVKNPVAAVRAAGEALERGPCDAERAARLARVLADASRRLDRVVSELLELARADAGLRGEPRAPVDVAALARGLVGAFAADERHADQQWSVQGPTSALVPGVASRLETALRNLLANAADFAGPHGWIRVELRIDVTVVHVAVHDSGPGVPDSERERIFERFHTTRPGAGTGLGLPLVRAIADAHGGAVWAESTAGGTRFVLELPRDGAL